MLCDARCSSWPELKKQPLSKVLKEDGTPEGPGSGKSMCKGPEAEDPGVQGQKASVAGKGWEEEDVGGGEGSVS